MKYAIKGTQTWEVDADSPAEAIRKFHAGDAQFIGEELEVQEIGEPEIVE